MNEQVWRDYSADHSGFCVGFNTIELCRGVKSGFGHMQYNDAAIVHRFINKSDDDPDILYYKKQKWAVENEFRCITVGIGKYSTRVQTFKPETIVEVLLGYNMLPEHEQQIINNVLNEKYPPGLKVFRTKRNADNSLGRVRIK